jgi:hypothetical protein
MSQIIPSPEMMPVFAATRLILHPDSFTIVSLPVNEKEKALELFKQVDPFSSISVDNSEVSLIISEAHWTEIQENFKEFQIEGSYKVITFDIVLDLNLVGFLSVVSAVLAEEGISIYAVSTFLRDHILVKQSQANQAIKSLEALIHRSITHQ